MIHVPSLCRKIYVLSNKIFPPDFLFAFLVFQALTSQNCLIIENHESEVETNKQKLFLFLFLLFCLRVPLLLMSTACKAPCFAPRKFFRNTRRFWLCLYFWLKKIEFLKDLNFCLCIHVLKGQELLINMVIIPGIWNFVEFIFRNFFKSNCAQRSWGIIY